MVVSEPKGRGTQGWVETEPSTRWVGWVWPYGGCVMASCVGIAWWESACSGTVPCRVLGKWADTVWWVGAWRGAVLRCSGWLLGGVLVDGWVQGTQPMCWASAIGLMP